MLYDSTEILEDCQDVDFPYSMGCSKILGILLGIVEHTLDDPLHIDALLSEIESQVYSDTDALECFRMIEKKRDRGSTLNIANDGFNIYKLNKTELRRSYLNAEYGAISKDKCQDNGIISTYIKEMHNCNKEIQRLRELCEQDT